MITYNKRLEETSRKLRRSMTDAENLLWARMRRKQLKEYQFYRQKIIGNFIVDFYCPKSNLVVEIDGGQHYSDEGKEKDKMRDGYMKSVQLKVLRFSDREVFENIDGVMERIWRNL
jgi:very-short-patch-repair endonuclease